MALRYPEDIEKSSDYIQFDFYEYKSPINNPAGGFNTSYQTNLDAASKTKIPGKTIILNMPSDVGTNFNGRWGGATTTSLAQAALGTIGAPIATAMKGGGVQSVQNTISTLTNQQTYKNALKAAGDDIIKELANSFAKLPGLGSLQPNDVLQLTTSSILNPNTELLYSGFDLRQHGYTFKMIPRTRGEAQNVLDIVKQFKEACLPDFAKGIFGTSGKNFISIPNLCQVTFHSVINGRMNENPHLPKYKLSGITGVNVSYVTDGNYMSFSDGKPIGVQLTVSFTEAKLVFKDEISNNSYR